MAAILDSRKQRHICVQAQVAQAHYVWVRASEVIWSEYTIYYIYSVQYSMERKSTKRRLNRP